MLQKEVIEAGEQIASDLMDAQITKSMDTMGGHVVKKISEYNNSDLVQKYLDNEIVSVEAIYVAMQRADKNGSSHDCTRVCTNTQKCLQDSIDRNMDNEFDNEFK